MVSWYHGHPDVRGWDVEYFKYILDTKLDKLQFIIQLDKHK